MASARDLLRTYLRYADWADTTLLAACTALSNSDLERDLGMSHGSILGTLRHTYLSDRAWCDRLLAGALPALADIGAPELFSGTALSLSLADLERYWPEIPESLLHWLECTRRCWTCRHLSGLV